MGTPTYPQSWTRARLIDPPTSGFVLLALTSGSWKLPPALPSSKRRALLRGAGKIAAAVRPQPGITGATVFSALVRPPGGESAGGQVAFDVIVLVETADVATASALAGSSLWRHLVAGVSTTSVDTLEFVASSPRRIAPVDHDRKGVFLFNFFSAPDVEKNLFAWQYTAGWFQDQTGLDNSTLMQPVDGPYTLVNHCRWDHLADILPSLVFKKSFRDFVLGVFAENGVEPRPLLYRLAR